MVKFLEPLEVSFDSIRKHCRQSMNKVWVKRQIHFFSAINIVHEFEIWILIKKNGNSRALQILKKAANILSHL